jgi:hypothetical protein
MLHVAAQAWNASNERRLPTDRATWIAAQVNKKFGKVQFIYPKWVNQNRMEIEAMASKRISIIPLILEGTSDKPSSINALEMDG